MLTQAFADYLARDIPFFGGGGPGYYGVRLENVAPDGSELDLIVTLRAGERYCCSQPGCHFDFLDAGAWSELRRDMDEHGLRGLPLPIIRTLRIEVEEGAMLDPGGLRVLTLSHGYAHEDGPIPPVIERGSDDSRPPSVSSTDIPST